MTLRTRLLGRLITACIAGVLVAAMTTGTAGARQLHRRHHHARHHHARHHHRSSDGQGAGRPVPLLTESSVPPGYGAFRFSVQGTGGWFLHAHATPDSDSTVEALFTANATLWVHCQAPDTRSDQSLVWDEVFMRDLFSGQAVALWVNDLYVSTPGDNGKPAYSPGIPSCAEAWANDPDPS